AVPDTGIEAVRGDIDELVIHGDLNFDIRETLLEHRNGWPATDWVEDIMLRMQPQEAYDKWTTNELKFTDPAVVAALDEFGKF
ncbi:hypothetical protein ACC691_40290, partial [Rhizobium johnstonii]